MRRGVSVWCACSSATASPATPPAPLDSGPALLLRSSVAPALLLRSSVAPALLHPSALPSAALALPALAGEKGHTEKSFKKCNEDTQTCLNHMASMYKGRGWLGIQMDVQEKSGAWRVTKVIPGSPAEAAGFQTDDVLVSVNGVKFADNTEAKMVTFEKTKDSWVPGGKLDYVVSRGGKEVNVSPTLAAMPPDAMATMIGIHMLEHASTEDVAKK